MSHLMGRRFTSKATQNAQTMAAPALRKVALRTVALREVIGDFPAPADVPLMVALAPWPEPARPPPPLRVVKLVISKPFSRI